METLITQASLACAANRSEAARRALREYEDLIAALVPANGTDGDVLGARTDREMRREDVL